MTSKSLPETPSIHKTPNVPFTTRVIKTSFFVGALLTFLFFATNHLYAGWGFLIGALLSLFSFVTIAFAVPFLLRPKAPRTMSTLSALVLMMKMPIYCVALYLATHLPWPSAFTCASGICLTPAVITLKTLGAYLRRSGSNFLFLLNTST